MKLTNKNVRLARGRTSVRLEPAFWEAMDEMCAAEGVSRDEFAQFAEQSRGDGTLATAVRVMILEYFRHRS